MGADFCALFWFCGFADGMTVVDKWFNRFKVRDEIADPFKNFNDAAVYAWEWITDFILHLTGYAITYPCWEYSWSMLIRGAPGVVILL